MFDAGRSWSYRYKIRGRYLRNERAGYGPVKHDEIESCLVAEVKRFEREIARRVVCKRVMHMLTFNEPKQEIYRGLGALYILREQGLWRFGAGARIPKTERALKRLSRGKPFLANPIVAGKRGRKGGASWTVVESGDVALLGEKKQAGWCREDGKRQPGALHKVHRLCFVPEVGLARYDVKNDFTTVQIDVTAESVIDATSVGENPAR